MTGNAPNKKEQSRKCHNHAAGIEGTRRCMISYLRIATEEAQNFVRVLIARDMKIILFPFWCELLSDVYVQEFCRMTSR